MAAQNGSSQQSKANQEPGANQQPVGLTQMRTHGSLALKTNVSQSFQSRPTQYEQQYGKVSKRQSETIDIDSRSLKTSMTRPSGQVSLALPPCFPPSLLPSFPASLAAAVLANQ